MTTWDRTVVGVVLLPDGRLVRGTSVRRARVGVPDPDLAVELLSRRPGVQPWPVRWVRWRDFGLPVSTDAAVETLFEAHERAATQRVEIACSGGVGRTGTAISVLAIMSGVPAAEAIAWTRASYHSRAVEAPAQRRWILSTAPILRTP